MNFASPPVPESVITRTPRRFERVVLLPLACLTIWLTQAASGAVVLDQIGSLASFDSSDHETPTPSQIFTDFPNSSCTVLEDFSVTSDELRITRVSVLFRAQGGFEKFQDIGSYYLNFFSDVNLAGSDLEGDVESLTILAGAGMSVTQIMDTNGTYEFGLVVLNVNVLLPSAGTYWVGVSPVADYTVAGQFFAQTTSTGTTGQANARLANPGEELGQGALSILGDHYAYSVTAVPEPASLSFCILGATWWLSRRKRGIPSTEIF